MAQAGLTHDITTTRNGITTGWMLEPGSYRVKRANNFAPKIAQGQLQHSDLDLWPSIDVPDLANGLGAEYLTNDNHRYLLNNLSSVETSIPGRVTLMAAPLVSENFVAYVYRDYGNYMYAGGASSVRRYDPAGQTWADSKTGLAAAVVDMQVCFNKLYVGLGDAQDMWSFDGATWAAVTGKKARCFAVWQTKLWRGNAGNIIPFDGAADGTTVAIGDPQSNITSIIPETGYLVIFKDDGRIYIYDGTTISDFTKYPAYTGSFKFPATLNGSIYFGALSSIVKMSASLSAPQIQTITPNNPYNIPYGWGIPVAFSNSPNYVYCILFSSSDGNAYIMKWNGQGWHNIDATAADSANAIYYSRLTGMVWFNTTYLGTGYSIFLRVSTTNDMPYGSAYPTTGSPYYVYLPHMTAGLDDIDKLWRDVRVVADNLTSNINITVDYQPDRNGVWTNVGTAIQSPIQTLNFPTNGVVAKDMWLRVGLTTNASNITPVLKYLSISYQPRPRAIYSITANVVIDDNIHLKDGSGNDPNTSAQLLSELMAMASYPSAVTLVGEDGITYQIIETNVGWVESLRGDRGVSFRAPVTWVQASSTTVTVTNSPTLGVDSNAVGTVAWTNPTNIYVKDSTYAKVITTGQSHYLKATGFGFNVPSTATINGISVNVSKVKSGAHPQTVINDPTLYNNPWSNVNNIKEEDSSYASATASVPGLASTDYIRGTNLGFNVPGGATIKGIKIDVLYNATSTQGGHGSPTSYCFIYKPGLGYTVGRSTALIVDGLKHWVSFGGSSDLFGQTYTSANINDPTFGAGILFGLSDTDSCTMNIDTIKMTVYYNSTDTSVGAVMDASVKLVKGGVVSGTDHFLGTDWPDSTSGIVPDNYADTVYGSSTDLWGIAPAYSDINASNFGVVISETATNYYAYIDYISITIYYSIN